MTTIFVTGAAGYIGSVTCLQLIKEGYNVIMYDNMTYGSEANLKAIESISGKKNNFHKGDIRDVENLRKIFKKVKPEVIMHFAALISVPESVDKPLDYYDVNVTGTMRLLQVAKEFKVNKFILSSTAAVFGDHNVMPLLPTSPTVPINPYGESKLIIEKLLKSMCDVGQMNAVIFRYFNAAGAHPSGKMGATHSYHLVPVLMQVATGVREKLTIFGTDYPTKDGTCVRDYVHVCDLASAHILGAQYLMKHANEKVYKRYNLGNGEGHSVKEVLQACRNVTELELPSVDGKRRQGDPPTLTASPKAAIDELGWKPSNSSIEQIVEDAYRYYINKK
mmetsp:Transcript_4547/g.6701  ORF Transcript_4547/g.6701 Transcript_4547/m.6701 type:complete len:334 (-) Transcript_4547:1213-2214(-)